MASGKGLTTSSTITVTLSGSCVSDGGATEYSGIASSGSPAVPTVDQSANVTDAVAIGSTVATGANSAQGGDLVVTACGVSSSTVGATVGSSDADSGGTWNTLTYTGINSIGAAYELAPGTPSEFQAVWTGGAGVSNNSSAIVAYSPAGGGSTPVSSSDTDSGTDAGETMHVDDAQGYP